MIDAHVLHLAAAGGGSSGFGGGGGGGGGGGRGFALYIVFRLLFDLLIWGHGIGALIVVGLIVLVLLYAGLMPRIRAFWREAQNRGPAAKRRTAKRERRVELAAAEASEQNESFAPEVVRAAAAKLFLDVQDAWDASDRRRLTQLVAPELMREWERRLDDFDRKGWRNRTIPVGEPTVTYVGLQHHDDDRNDRVVVRVQAKVRDYVEDAHGNHIKHQGSFTDTVSVREFWTLGQRNGRWVLMSIEQGAEGSHALQDKIVATAWSDDERMQDEALTEQAIADAVPEGTKVAEVADVNYTGDARAAANDLSVADGRFAPAILEVAARRAVAAWAEAVDGDDAQLRGIARSDAVDELLHPGDPSHQTRVVVRGPTVKEIRILKLDAASEPPTMEIVVELVGRRYIQDRDTAAVLAGSQERATKFTEQWLLALDGDDAQPWRIAAVRSPVGHV